MARPSCCRRISAALRPTHFMPKHGVDSSTETVRMTMDELEALRLADHEGLYQAQAALQMNVSRATFGRILASAHAKVADSLMNGKSLHIGGGNIARSRWQSISCPSCRRRNWRDQSIVQSDFCPRCKGKKTGEYAGLDRRQSAVKNVKSKE